MKKMNLPNKLTILRMILVPVFIVFMALPTEWVWPVYTAFGIFVLASITDQLDGFIARKYNLVTKFGKIMDPLADKLLVAAGFVMLVGLNVIPAWIVAVIIARDFFVNGLRMFGADNNKDLAAGISGKIKTAFQLIAIPLAILGVALNPECCSFGIFLQESIGMSMLELLVNVLMTVSITAVALATVWSFVDYLLRFKDDLKEENENDNEKVEAEEVSEETTEVVENVENAEENNNVEE